MHASVDPMRAVRMVTASILRGVTGEEYSCGYLPMLIPANSSQLHLFAWLEGGALPKSYCGMFGFLVKGNV